MALYSGIKVGPDHPFFKERYKVPLVVNLNNETVVNTKLIMLYSMIYLYYYRKEPDHWLLKNKEEENETEINTLIYKKMFYQSYELVTIPIQNTWLLDLLMREYRYEYIFVDYYMLSRRVRKYDGIRTDNFNLKKVMKTIGVIETNNLYSSVSFRQMKTGLEHALFPTPLHNTRWDHLGMTNFREWSSFKDDIDALTGILEEIDFEIEQIRDLASTNNTVVFSIEKLLSLKDLTLDDFLLQTQKKAKEHMDSCNEYNVSTEIRSYLDSNLNEGVKYRIEKAKNAEYLFLNSRTDSERFYFDFSRSISRTKNKTNSMMKAYVDRHVNTLFEETRENTNQNFIAVKNLEKVNYKVLINPKFLMQV